MAEASDSKSTMCTHSVGLRAHAVNDWLRPVQFLSELPGRSDVSKW